MKIKLTALFFFIVLFMVQPSSSMVVDCTHSAEQVVTETKGELLSALVEMQDNKVMCKITILIRNSSSQRPRKMSIMVPQQIN